MRGVRLDDLYKMIAYIYGDRNRLCHASMIFIHLVESCGMLAAHDRKKKRDAIEIGDALCKALGWYLALMAKFHVKSVEELVYRKFPLACPYCLSAPHREVACKLGQDIGLTVDSVSVRALYRQNADRRPATLNEWQSMFQRIYPRKADERGRSTVGLLEEIGELAEALRMHRRHPKYFLGEAADTFSYLMGIANEHALRLRRDKNVVFSLEEEFLARYPGLCLQCGYRVCACPAAPGAAASRPAKEMDIDAADELFMTNRKALLDAGSEISGRVLERMARSRRRATRSPFDPGGARPVL